MKMYYDFVFKKTNKLKIHRIPWWHHEVLINESPKNYSRLETNSGGSLSLSRRRRKFVLPQYCHYKHNIFR